MRIRAGVSSHLGLVRQTNEDSYLVRPGLYAVCDGMGGARAGEVASEMACKGLLSLDPATATPEELVGAILEIDKAIARRGQEEAHLAGMGTTLTAALVGEGSLIFAHVGDSRAYLLHDGTLTQVTNDHSWVGEMVRRGELTPAQAAVHPHRSVITRVLGTDGDVPPDMFAVPVEPGDRLLLCSDGLSGMVSDAEIAEILQRGRDPQATAEALVHAALVGGGEDNVTAVVADVLPPAVPNEERMGDETSVEDWISLGPEDRGAVFAESEHGRVVRGGFRERLGGRIGPLLRPVAERPPRDDLTVQIPAVTIVGGMPAVTPPAATQDVSASAEALTETPTAGRGRRTRRKWTIVASAVVILIVIIIVAFAIFNSTVYYVGRYDGMVALYQGLPGNILGIELSSVIEQANVAYAALAPYIQTRVDSHDLVSKEEGRLFLRTLSAQQ